MKSLVNKVRFAAISHTTFVWKSLGFRDQKKKEKKKKKRRRKEEEQKLTEKTRAGTKKAVFNCVFHLKNRVTKKQDRQKQN